MTTTSTTTMTTATVATDDRFDSHRLKVGRELRPAVVSQRRKALARQADLSTLAPSGDC
jgi:hypothetical protein